VGAGRIWVVNNFYIARIPLLVLSFIRCLSQLILEIGNWKCHLLLNNPSYFSFSIAAL
jgi:hypothetical protein